MVAGRKLTSASCPLTSQYYVTCEHTYIQSLFPHFLNKQTVRKKKILVTPALKILEPWDCEFKAGQLRFSLTQNKQIS